MKRIPAALYIILGAAIIVALLLYWVQGPSDDAVAIERAKIALAQGKSYRQRIAKVQAIAERAMARATVAIASDHAKDGAIRHLTVQLAQDSTARDSVVTLLAVRDTLTVQRDSARAAVASLLLRVTSDSVLIAISRQRVDSLELHLANVLTIADCRILHVQFLPRCPSRTTATIVGVGLGVAVSLTTLR